MNALLSAFEFESELSSNSTGAVYYARKKSQDHHVAIKLFSREKGRDDRFLASLKRASDRMSGLKHPNLIGFLDSGLIDGMPFVVMEFVPGKSLHRSTHGRTIEFNQSLAIINEVCQGIAYAHANHVVHGNLSPLNILLNQEATPKIGNFAMGRSIHTLHDVQAPSHFSAPEVLAGEPHTVASDVYSLGAILYELITATPYRAGAPKASSLEGVPKDVDAVIAKATATDPKQRHTGAMEFYKALKKAAFAEPETEPEPEPEPKQDAASSPPGARSKAMELAMSTTGTGLVLKLAIIAILIIAIQQVWSYRTEEQQRRGLTSNGASSSGDDSINSFEMTPQQRQAQLQKQQLAQQPDPMEFPDDPETPAQSLERLRAQLIAGNYSELPIGTLSQGGSHYFLVEEAMGWQAAVAHAEQLGATVALPKGDLSWSKKEPFGGKSFWVGAGLSGNDGPVLLDGGEWQLAGVGDGVGGIYLHLDETGNFMTAGAATQLPYAIQWSEGVKPLSLEQRLAVCAASIQSGKPVYPPGTLAVGERRYLPVQRSLSWEEARGLARSAGGHLLALSGDKESFELENWGGQLVAGMSYWLGGRLNGESWQWENDEPWAPVEWSNVSNAAADDVALVLLAGTGFDARARSSAADGFIIEWSKDHETNKLRPGQLTTPLASPTEVTKMAGELVIKAIADKEAAHVKNTSKLAWDLDSHLRGLKKSDQERWAPEADKLKACVQNNRLHKETVEGSGAQLSPFMSKLCDYLIRKQGEIDEQHVKNLQAIHGSYLRKLGQLRDQAKARGQVKAQIAADELIEGSRNLDSWIARMSVAPTQQ
jgi:serine/threonine protein kinase